MVAGGQAAHAEGGIGVVGGAQVVLDGHGVGQIADVATFEASDGQTYLLTLGRDSIRTINVADPLDPIQTGSITRDWFIESWFENVEVFYASDGRVYAAVTSEGLLILDVTDPANPEMVYGAPMGADISLAFGDAWQVAVSEWPDGRVHALVAGGDGTLRVVDITDPHNPVPLEEGPDSVLTVASDANFLGFFEPGDGHIYTVYNSRWMGISIVDVTDPARLVPVSAVRPHDGGHFWEHEDPFHAYGVSAPLSSDVLISDTYAEGLRYADRVVVFGPHEGRTYAMVANSMITVTIKESDPYIVPAGIIFLDVTNPHKPVPVGAILDGKGKFDFYGRIGNIAILESPDGRVHAAVAGGQDVTILDITGPTGPVPVSLIRDGKGGFDYVGTVHSMAVIQSPDGRTYLAMTGDDGVQMADVTEPGAPVAAGGIPSASVTFSNPAVFETGDGRTYAVGEGGDAITLVNITDPRLPVPLSSVRDGEDGLDTLDGVRQVEALQTTDGRAYAMATGLEGLQVIDVTDPGVPVAAGALRNGTDGFATGWLVSTDILRHPKGADYLLVGYHGVGIHSVDITRPQAPILAGSLWGGVGGINLLGGIHDMDVFFDAADGWPYILMTGDWGIHTIDMANPAVPAVVGTIDGTVNGTMGEYSLISAYQSIVFEPASGQVYALVADYMTGIHIIDLTDPHAPVHTGSVAARIEGGVEVIPGTGITAVISPDGRVWALVIGSDVIQILEITDPHAPTLADSILIGEGGLGLDQTPWDIITLEPAGERIHALASGDNHLWILDVTYPLASMEKWGRDLAVEDGVVMVSITAGSNDAGCAECNFFPQTVTVNVGDTVTWVNRDDTAHGFVGTRDMDGWAAPAFSTFGLLPGDDFSHRFENAGEYTYMGVPHPWMTGRVVVVE